MTTTADNTTNLGNIDWREASEKNRNYGGGYYCANGEHDFSGELPYNHGPERVCVRCGYCNWWDAQ